MKTTKSDPEHETGGRAGSTPALSPFESIVALARKRAEAARTAAEAGATDAQQAKAERIAKLLDARERASTRPPSRSSVRWWGASLVAVAAAVALYVARAPRVVEDVEPAPIAYVASVTGHVAHERSAGAAPVDVLFASSDAALEVVLNATAPVSFAPSVTVLAVRGGTAARMDVPVEVSTSGSVRFEVQGATLAGVSELRVVVSRAVTHARDVRAASQPPAGSVSSGAALVVIPVVVDRPR